jgi:hypothetical protein
MCKVVNCRHHYIYFKLKTITCFIYTELLLYLLWLTLFAFIFFFFFIVVVNLCDITKANACWLVLQNYIEMSFDSMPHTVVRKHYLLLMARKELLHLEANKASVLVPIDNNKLLILKEAFITYDIRDQALSNFSWKRFKNS